MKYQITKKQCQQEINKLNNVCDYCGRKPQPLKTVDNSGSPTYWSGCYHGNTEKGAWGHFTGGIKKEIYDLAVRLVLDNDTDFGMSYDDRQSGDFNYAFREATRRACSKLRTIEYLKNNNPRYDKEQLKEMYFPKKLKSNT